MRKMKSNLAAIALAIVLITNAFSALADEKLSSAQTALSSTTISGFVSTDILVPTISSTSAAWQPTTGNLNSAATIPEGGNSSVLMNSFYQTPTSFQLPSLPSSPDLQNQFSQTGIQPAPEPTTLTLGGLALGLIAFIRLNRFQGILKCPVRR
jgi:hypothetical protein